MELQTVGGQRVRNRGRSRFSRASVMWCIGLRRQRVISTVVAVVVRGWHRERISLPRAHNELDAEARVRRSGPGCRGPRERDRGPRRAYFARWGGGGGLAGEAPVKSASRSKIPQSGDPTQSGRLFSSGS